MMYQKLIRNDTSVSIVGSTVVVNVLPIEMIEYTLEAGRTGSMLPSILLKIYTGQKIGVIQICNNCVA